MSCVRPHRVLSDCSEAHEPSSLDNESNRWCRSLSQKLLESWSLCETGRFSVRAVLRSTLICPTKCIFANSYLCLVIRSFYGVLTYSAWPMMDDNTADDMVCSTAARASGLACEAADLASYVAISTAEVLKRRGFSGAAAQRINWLVRIG